MCMYKSVNPQEAPCTAAKNNHHHHMMHVLASSWCAPPQLNHAQLLLHSMGTGNQPDSSAFIILHNDANKPPKTSSYSNKHPT